MNPLPNTCLGTIENPATIAAELRKNLRLLFCEIGFI
jgi:hypothetical protein